MNILKLVQKIGTIGYVLSLGWVIGEISIYLFMRWDVISNIRNISTQSLLLLAVLFIYISYSLVLLLVKNFRELLLGFDCMILLLSVGVKLYVLFEYYTEELPFELVYAIEDVSLIVFFMCLFHIIHLGKLQSTNGLSQTKTETSG